jgi:hypothetical protein
MAPVTEALPAAITGIDVLHGSIGPNLDTALIPTATVALSGGARRYPSTTSAATRGDASSPRQKVGLKSGVITGPASLRGDVPAP